MSDLPLLPDEFDGDANAQQDNRGPSRIRRSSTSASRKSKSRRSRPSNVARKGIHQRRIKRMSW